MRCHAAVGSSAPWPPSLGLAQDRTHAALHYLSEKNTNPLPADLMAELEPLRTKLREVMAALGVLIERRGRR
jgi:hypothetical protein